MFWNAIQDREVVVQAIKSHNISKVVDYRMHDLEPMTFYRKCIRYGVNCGWLARASFNKNKHIWLIRKYSGPHTYARTRISQDHMKLDSDTVTQCIEPMV